MKAITYWIKLIRAGNLLMMILIVWLVNQWLVAPFLDAAGIIRPFDLLSFLLLVFPVVATAAAANIINDIVDQETDRINKPEKLIINRFIPEIQAKYAYKILVGLGSLSALILSILLHSIYFFLITAVFNGLLWFYSQRYKQQFLVGNIVVAFLGAGLIFYVWLFDLLVIIQDPISNARLEPVMGMMTEVILIYAAFAFLSSLIREVIKDMEDLKGDFKTGCRTISVVLGLSVTTKMVWILIVTLTLLIVWWQILLFNNGAQAAFGFLFVTDSLLLISAMQLANQSDQQRFKRSSTLMKLVMLTGILSIAFIHL
ncbi:MAG: hypothetical protein PWQ54_2232 [Bacteroidales bacterium]|jgi:4-hydroxybenzoate polyprenyltransferase|nr:hypothetical protein [Bacteroidales bacterium]